MANALPLSAISATCGSERMLGAVLRSCPWIAPASRRCVRWALSLGEPAARSADDAGGQVAEARLDQAAWVSHVVAVAVIRFVAVALARWRVGLDDKYDGACAPVLFAQVRVRVG